MNVQVGGSTYTAGVGFFSLADIQAWLASVTGGGSSVSGIAL